jgi:T5SS/PEP-CTERM-associated repeat protein
MWIQQNNAAIKSLLMKGKMMKRNLQQKQYKTFFGRNAILLAITALALFALPGVALSADCLSQTNWVGTNGSWFDSGNWSGGVVPTSGIAAVIDNGGKAQISGSTPLASACSLALGPTAGHSGNVSVSTSGSLTVTYGITVGDQGTGSLSVTSQGSVTTQLGEVDVGGNTSGVSATGLLTVTNGGTVSTPSVVVNGSGTLTGNGTVSTTNGTIIEGTLAPSGTLTISGDLRFPVNTSNMSCNVSSSSVDNVQVSGIARLNGKLSVTVNVTGDFTLLHAGQGRNGTTFQSYSFTYTGCLSASVSYQDNSNGSSDVKLHVVSTCN